MKRKNKLITAVLFKLAAFLHLNISGLAKVKKIVSVEPDFLAVLNICKASCFADPTCTKHATANTKEKTI